MFAELGFCLPNFFGKLIHMPDTTDSDLHRFGDAVRQRRLQLGLSQEEVAAKGGPSDTTLTKIENYEWTSSRPNETLRKLDIGLDWIAGSAKSVLAGANPLGETPDLPRHASHAEVFSTLSRRLGDRIATSDSGSVTGEARRVLSSIRNRLAHSRPDFTADELQTLQGIIEDSELESLHVRIDWLSRPSQLEISAHVDELLAAADQEIADAGITNEDEFVPDYLPHPNPLPYQGLRPLDEGVHDDTNQPQQGPGTSGTVDRGTGGGAEGRTPPMKSDPSAGTGAFLTTSNDGISDAGKADALIEEDQGAQPDYELARRKGLTQERQRRLVETEPEDESQDTGDETGA